ncbi:inorganic pyrophosphatase [Gongronella butleri]|nr:inorganic pyrophosphatase [Gongronella butleri]
MRLSAFIAVLLAMPMSQAVSGPWQPEDLRLREVGTKYSPDYAVYYETKECGKVISPFHDISLFTETPGVFNMVVEIPRWTNAKFEINKETFLNPIKQDTKNGKVRYVPNLFPLKGYPGNYGALPQTWEDPNIAHKDTGAGGDNDPIDVFEIGDEVGYTGQIKQVKVLGVLAMVDSDETDWKLLTIDVKDPLASKINDVYDIDVQKPGLLSQITKFLITYKLPSGGARNIIAFNSKPQSKAYAVPLVFETHNYWKALVNGTTVAKEISKENYSLRNSPFLIPDLANVTSVPSANEKPAASIPPEIDIWYNV